MKKIVILCTLDTKAEPILYLKEKIEARGHKTTIIDLSTGDKPPFEADVTPEEIAELAGEKIESLRNNRERDIAIKAMIDGARQKTMELFSRKELDGIVALGGPTMALIGSCVMQNLPFGVPKVIAVPNILPSRVAAWFDAMDVTVVQLIVEIAAMNKLVKQAIESVAGVIAGCVESYSYPDLSLPYPAIALTQYDFSQQCARCVEKLLKEKGYNVFSFHAQGISDRAMERFITQGYFDGVIELTPGGLIEEIFDGNRAAGKSRLDAAIARGLPQVMAPSGINITGCGPTRKNRQKYASRRRILQVDELRCFTRYSASELKAGAKIYAEKLNKSIGPIRIMVPLKGWNSIDKTGSILHNPKGDMVFINELKKHLKPQVIVREADSNLEDPEFAQLLVDNFDEIFRGARQGTYIAL